MSYFTSPESSIPTVEEVAQQGTRLRVTIRAGRDRYILHDVVDLAYAVGDEVPEWRQRIRFARWSPRPAWSAFTEADDD